MEKVCSAAHGTGRISWSAGATFILLAVAGCTTAPDPVLGEATRNMVAAQLYNPEAAANPDPRGVEGMDGQKAIQQLNQLERKMGAERRARDEIRNPKLEMGN